MTDDQAQHQILMQGDSQGAHGWRLLEGRVFVPNPEPVGSGSIHFEGAEPYCLYAQEVLPAGM